VQLIFWRNFLAHFLMFGSFSSSRRFQNCPLALAFPWMSVCSAKVSSSNADGFIWNSFPMSMRPENQLHARLQMESTWMMRLAQIKQSLENVCQSLTWPFRFAQCSAHCQAVQAPLLAYAMLILVWQIRQMHLEKDNSLSAWKWCVFGNNNNNKNRTHFQMVGVYEWMSFVYATD